MNDVRFVRGIERGEYLNTDVQNLIKLKPLPAKVVTQCFAVDVLSGDERQVIDFAEFENSKNVWLVQRRRYFRFLAKALHTPLVRGHVPREDLEGDGTIEPRIFSEVDFTHPA